MQIDNMQLSLDVFNLLIEDSVVTVLMSLTCRRSGLTPIDLSESTIDAMVRYCDSFTVNKLRLTYDLSRVIRMGRIDLLEERMRVDETDYLCCHAPVLAVQSGQLKMLEWFVHRGCGLSESVSATAAREGNLEIFKWCLDNGCPVHKRICAHAAMGGNFKILQLCRELGYGWKNKDVFSQAARGGHLELLQWMRANGCPWDEGACIGAAAHGDLPTLVWCIENGCPHDIQDCMSTAVFFKSHEIVKWLKARTPTDQARRN
jgi:hypothetical protein